ncbi:YMGG-like glycine zipper-containing protein [Sulfitobacter aestuarii]|uniref:YMGG-like glycine zipper-containing protein n=1 Tax=Sulfitobacter aestuarii TaxID=2161676 RepID=A0ABW5TYJ9_9RHOB
MKKFLIAIPMIAGLAACDTTNPNQGALTGAALGAAAGAAVSGGDDKVVGALVGGAAGAAAGNYLGRTSSGQCVYQNSAGQRYTAACP